MEINTNEFVIIALSHFIALLSPGADFIYLMNSSLANQSKVAIGASLGIALSNGFYILLCVLGYAAFFSKSVTAMTLIRLIGGGYLLYLGYTILKNKNASFTKLQKFNQSTFFKELIKGFYLSFLNPKISIFYISLFALVINKDTPMLIQLFYGLWMFLVVFIWDTMLIFLFNNAAIKKKIISFTVVHTIMGTMLLFMGLWLFIHLFMSF